MLIVSQDRETILNVNQTREITISFAKNGEEIIWVVSAGFDTENFEELGQYPTKERAVEVLEYLAAAYELRGKSFKMPKG